MREKSNFVTGIKIMKTNLFILIFLACVGYNIQAMDSTFVPIMNNAVGLQRGQTEEALTRCNNYKCLQDITGKSVFCPSCEEIDSKVKIQYCSKYCRNKDENYRNFKDLGVSRQLLQQRIMVPR